MDSLAFSVFPPTPPSSASSPSLMDAPPWPSSSTAAWCDGSTPSWALDGLPDAMPDAKPDVSELLQTSLFADLPVLNADSTHFLLDGDADASLAAVPAVVAEPALATQAAPWPPQWTYCAYCAAGETPSPVHGDSMQGQGLHQSQQLYPQQGVFFDPYFPAPMSTVFSEGLGLVYVDNPVQPQAMAGVAQSLPQTLAQALPQGMPHLLPQTGPLRQPPPPPAQGQSMSLPPSLDLEGVAPAQGELCWAGPHGEDAAAARPAAAAVAAVVPEAPGAADDDVESQGKKRVA